MRVERNKVDCPIVCPKKYNLFSNIFTVRNICFIPRERHLVRWLILRKPLTFTCRLSYNIPVQGLYDVSSRYRCYYNRTTMCLWSMFEAIGASDAIPLWMGGRAPNI